MIKFIKKDCTEESEDDQDAQNGNGPLPRVVQAGEEGVEEEQEKEEEDHYILVTSTGLIVKIKTYGTYLQRQRLLFR